MDPLSELKESNAVEDSKCVWLDSSKANITSLKVALKIYFFKELFKGKGYSVRSTFVIIFLQ